MWDAILRVRISFWRSLPPPPHCFMCHFLSSHNCFKFPLYNQILDGEIFSVFLNGLKPWFIEMKIHEIFCKNHLKWQTTSKCPFRPADIYAIISVVKIATPPPPPAPRHIKIAFNPKFRLLNVLAERTLRILVHKAMFVDLM